jgi:hypothetical protein
MQAEGGRPGSKASPLRHHDTRDTTVLSVHDELHTFLSNA